MNIPNDARLGIAVCGALMLALAGLAGYNAGFSHGQKASVKVSQQDLDEAREAGINDTVQQAMAWTRDLCEGARVFSFKSGDGKLYRCTRVEKLRLPDERAL